MDLELKGRVAIVTGGSRGIGLAIGRVLAAEGANVALVARNEAALDGAAAQISGQGGGAAKGFACDTTDDAAVKGMVADVVAAFGRVDILVNCAAKPSGQARPPTIGEITTEEFWDHMNTKVMGYLRTAREVAPHMIKQGSGRIINVSGLGAQARRHHHRQHPQRRRGGADQEPRRRAGPARHPGDVRASGAGAHGGDARRDRVAGQDAGRQRGRDREAHGRRATW